MNIFLDTDVIINILKKKKETIDKFKTLVSQKSNFYISAIIIAEIYAGAKKQEHNQIEQLFSFFDILDINSNIGYIAGNYANIYKKAYNKISLEDYLIASTTKFYNLKLWTYNKKHYPMDDIDLIY